MSNYNINLLGEGNHSDKPYDVVSKRARVMRAAGLVILFFAGAFSMILSVLTIFSPLPELRKVELKAKNELDNYKLDIAKLFFINDRTDSIRNILGKRLSYDKKVEIVQGLLPPDVAFEGMKMQNKSYSLKFSSTNLEALDQLLKSLTAITGRKLEFERIYLTMLSINEDRGTFEMVVDLLSV